MAWRRFLRRGGDDPPYVAVTVRNTVEQSNYFAGAADSNIIAEKKAGTKFYAIAGQSYKICVYNYQPDRQDFTMTLSCDSSLPPGTQFVEPLANDDFDNALALSLPQVTFVQYVRHATIEPFELDFINAVKAFKKPRYGYTTGGVWIRYTAPASGTVSFSAINPAKNDEGKTRILVVAAKGSSIDTLTPIAVGEQGCSFRVTQGQVYQLYLNAPYGRFPDYQNTTQLVAKIGLRGSSVPAIFGAQAGPYSALFDTNGMVALTLSKTGAFSGKLAVNGLKYKVRGKLDANGDFTGTASGSSLPFTLNLDMAAPTDVPGNIAIPGTAGGRAFIARHGVYNPALPLSQTGSYTALLGQSDTGISIPQGYGYAFIKVDRKGKTSMKGKLADGTSHSSAGVLVGDGNYGVQFIVFNNNIHGNLGLLSGVLPFEARATSDFTATVVWHKPQRPNDKYYAAGFDAELTVEGARYIKPVREIALNFPGTSDNATFTASGGALPAELVTDLTLAASNKITVSGANAENLSLKLNTGNGGFGGSFIHPASQKLVKFSGVIFRKSAAPKAGGYFIGPTGLSGIVSLEP